LVDNDTTSGFIYSRVFNYEHGTFQIRNKNPPNIISHGDRQGLVNKIYFYD